MLLTQRAKTDRDGEKRLHRKRKQRHKSQWNESENSKYVPRKHSESVLGTWLTHVSQCVTQSVTHQVESACCGHWMWH